MQTIKEKEFLKALAEVNYILKYTDENLLKKIPQSFWNFIEENKDKDYRVTIDVNNSLEQQDILEDTKNIMAMIYRNFFCTSDEKEEYDKILGQNQDRFEQEINEKYSYENLFRNNKVKEEILEEQAIENTQMIEYKKENVVGKIIRCIKNFFLKLKR